MKTIGIIGGSSDVATSEYYKLINAKIRARLGEYHTAEVIINSMDFGEVERLVAGNIWEEGDAYVHRHARALVCAYRDRCALANVDFVLCVSNTWHRVNFMRGLPTPLLHIVDPTANAILAAGLRKVLLLGTKSTMSADWMREIYTKRFSIDTVFPDAEDQDYINSVIFSELTQNAFTIESRQKFLEIVDKLCHDPDGAQGVILGCTEIGLLVKQADCPNVPFFDPVDSPRRSCSRNGSGWRVA